MRISVPPIAREALGDACTGKVRLHHSARTWIRRFAADEGAATAVEYGIIVAAIAAAIVGVVFLIGGDIAAVFEGIGNKLATRQLGSG